MIRKLTLALLLTLPTMAMAIDLEGYYITAKGGVSKSMNTGETNFTIVGSDTFTQKNEDLGTGTTFGFSVGKYLTDNLRLEIEATKRTGYEFDTPSLNNSDIGYKASMQTSSVFINGFYDFQPFSISNIPITPYLGGGVGISRNKMGWVAQYGVANGRGLNGNSINQFAYKLSAGTLFSLTENMSLDVSYQYVNLGAFKSGTTFVIPNNPSATASPAINGGEIKTQELMVGLQYKF